MAKHTKTRDNTQRWLTNTQNDLLTHKNEFEHIKSRSSTQWSVLIHKNKILNTQRYRCITQKHFLTHKNTFQHTNLQFEHTNTPITFQNTNHQFQLTCLESNLNSSAQQTKYYCKSYHYWPRGSSRWNSLI